MSTIRKFIYILDIHAGKNLGELRFETLLMEQLPKGLGGGCKSVKNADTFGFQQIEHLTQRRILSADLGKIRHSDFGKIQSEFTLIHAEYLSTNALLQSICHSVFAT
jgi:hypothetical protein